MLVTLTVEPKGLILCVVKICCLIPTSQFLPFFSVPLLSPDKTYWCVLRGLFSLGECM
ncbi:unnamed protein product [Staurois parvus]|uniref:Uncharacterized protein n=1 Tax=Staurois parvus TaxID=386267 RepID=A0ABN9H5B3_9NEOB|nr:unnamed protein product [Staurois parvus]